MRRLLVAFLATVGLIAILLAAAAGGLGWWITTRLIGEGGLPERMVLRLDLREAIGEAPGPTRLDIGRLADRPTVADLVLGLERAARDTRVAGLLLELGDVRHGFGVARELRQALLRLRAKGRFVVAWADSIGELGAGTEGYYLASAADELALQPVGQLGVTGLLVETPYARDLLDRLGIEPVVSRRAEHKTALEAATEREPTPAGREMMEWLAESLMRTIAGEVAASRRLDPERVLRLLGSGPYPAEEALALGLADRIAYRDEIEASVLARAGGEASIVGADRYLRERRAAPEGLATIGLLRAVGPIVRSGDELATTIGADDLADALEAAIDAPEIRGILLRLDTPGGSAVASETIARQIRRAIGAGKPVVVSMANQAASGGYWIAMDASRLVAQPTTLTGSIGVLAGKPVLADAWERLGVRWGRVAVGENAALWSINLPADRRARDSLERIVDGLYQTFKEGVARGRGLSPDRVEAVAGGRVWTGAQALELGLVDRLGGLPEALDEMRGLLGLPKDAPLRLRPIPDEEPLWRLATKLLARSAVTLTWVQDVLGGFAAFASGAAPLPTVR
jgi:protease-4